VSLRRLLATYLGPQRQRVLVLALLLAATIGVRLTNPQLLRAFIDQAAAGAPLASLIRIAALFLVAALALQVITLAEVFVAENVGLTATNWLRADLTRHVLRLDPPFHAAHTPGELIERTDGDVATLGNFFSRLVIQLAGNALLLAGILVLLRWWARPPPPARRWASRSCSGCAAWRCRALRPNGRPAPICSA
jgi:ABC-type multidrug transport system fused ATPase/permease subunit